MATVRFSKELIEKIIRNARNKMEPAITKAKEQKLDNAWGQRIYDTIFLEVKPIISQVPAGWFKMVDKICIEQVGDTRCDMQFTFATPLPWPDVFVATDIAKRDRSYSDGIALTDEHVWAEFYAEVVAYKQRVSIVKQRQNEFADMVKKVTEAYSTLAPALKAWPPPVGVDPRGCEGHTQEDRGTYQERGGTERGHRQTYCPEYCCQVRTLT